MELKGGKSRAMRKKENAGRGKKKKDEKRQLKEEEEIRLEACCAHDA